LSELWWLLQADAILIGLAVGSFLNVAILRLPEDRSLVPRSRCPRCGAPIRPRDNIPVLSWVLLRGKCRDCQGAIASTYPMVELLGGLLAWLAWRRFVPGPDQVDLAHLAAAAFGFAFLADLVVVAFSDIRTRLIPDQTTSWAIPLAVVAAVGLGWLGWDDPTAVGWRASVLGAAIWGGFMAIVASASNWLVGVEVLGWGDVKLVALIGAVLGPLGGELTLLLGSLSGAAVGLAFTVALRRRVYPPFGPPLAAAAAVYLLWGEELARALVPGAWSLWSHGMG
jgi:leader peptidase (prepilin peptidase)/N-methyltransferase